MKRMMKTIKDLRQEHSNKGDEFRKECPHKSVRIEQGSNYRYGYDIVLRCVICETPIVSWTGAEKPDYSQPQEGVVNYALGFIKETKTDAH
jgi:hypothetical protein